MNKTKSISLILFSNNQTFITMKKRLLAVDNCRNENVIAYEGLVLMFKATYSFNILEQKQRGRDDDANFKAGEMF